MEAIMSVIVTHTPFSRKALIALAGSAMLLSACASHHERTIPSWGGGSSEPPVVQQGTTYVPPEQAAAAYAPAQFTGRTTFTQGCTGGFSVRDTRTNREISSGRAYNSGQGLIVLDSAGRQVRALSTGAGNTSVLFLPDCNCRAGAQSGTVSPNQTFAARAPSAAACSAS
jgi:hypothetical protein